MAATSLLVLGGVAIRLRPPWHDEIYTLELARRPLAALLRALELDSGPPGHYLVARLLVLLGAGSLTWLRVVSLLAVAAGAAMLVATAARMSRSAAWPAAALLAAHPLLVGAAAEARAYALLFAAVAAVLLLLSAQITPRVSVALAALLAAACWLHALGLVVAAAVFVTGFVRRPGERLRLWLAVLGGLAAALAWLPVMSRQPVAALAWMDQAWSAMPWWRWLLPLLEPAPGVVAVPWGGLAAAPFGLVACAVTAWLVALWGARRGPRRVLDPALVWGSASTALVLLTVLARPVYAPGRSALVLLPPAALVAAVGIARLRRSSVRLAVLAALAGCAVWASATSLLALSREAPDPAADAARALAAAQPGDVVVTTGWWYLDVRHALGDAAADLSWRCFPAEQADHPGWYDDAVALRAAPDELPRLAHELAAARESGHRVWLLRSPRLPSDPLRTPLAGRLGLVPRADGRPYWVLWGPPGPSPAGSPAGV